MDVSTEILSDVSVWNKYARHIPSLSRRELFSEVCARYENMMVEKFPHISGDIIKNMNLVRDKKVLPSMRGMQFAGPAIEKNESRVYNCAYLPVDNHVGFAETMFLLLGGTGVGFGVQQHQVDKLPAIKKPTGEQKFMVEDSIEGWADAVKHLMKAYLGKKKMKPRFDFSAIRQKGERLVTAGGKAPGPEPLKICLQRIEAILNRFEDGERLRPIDCHDIECHIADAVLSGGIRRAAMISLFSRTDETMLKAKSSSVPSKILRKEHPTFTDSIGLQTDYDRYILDIEQDGIVYKDVTIRKMNGDFWDLAQYENDGTFGWWVCNPQRGRANNSVVLPRNQVSNEEWQKIWKMIQDSGSGEPGVYWTNNIDWGTNPCCEIALKPFQFCNLTEINGALIQTQEDLNEMAKAGAFLGTLQAAHTDFHYLRPKWRETTEKDALLGVGITGIASGAVHNLDLKTAAKHARHENERVAELLGINKASRVTTVKPSGTTSCVLGCSSGIHSWHDHYYIRRMQLNGSEALVPYLLKNHPEIIKEYEAIPGSYVLEFPQKAPEGAITRNDETAIEFLERVNQVNMDWVKKGHREGDNANNVSCTVSIKQHEWPFVGTWMWDNRETYNGISVLPYDGGTYKQAPFETITKEQYESMVEHLTAIDLSKVIEEDDNTDLNDQIACAGGACEVN